MSMFTAHFYKYSKPLLSALLIAKVSKTYGTSGFVDLVSLLSGEPFKLNQFWMSSISGLLFSDLSGDIQSGSDLCQPCFVLCFRSLCYQKVNLQPSLRS